MSMKTFLYMIDNLYTRAFTPAYSTEVRYLTGDKRMCFTKHSRHCDHSKPLRLLIFNQMLSG
jgi:hypothetical protein